MKIEKKKLVKTIRSLLFGAAVFAAAVCIAGQGNKVFAEAETEGAEEAQVETMEVIEDGGYGKLTQDGHVFLSKNELGGRSVELPKGSVVHVISSEYYAKTYLYCVGCTAPDGSYHTGYIVQSLLEPTTVLKGIVISKPVITRIIKSRASMPVYSSMYVSAAITGGAGTLHFCWYTEEDSSEGSIGVMKFSGPYARAVAANTGGVSIYNLDFSDNETVLHLAVWDDAGNITYSNYLNEVKLLVSAASLSEDCTVTLNTDSYVYTGKERKPSVTITVNKNTETMHNADVEPIVITGASDGYTLTYKKNVNAGTATVTVNGTGYPFTGSVSKTYTIKKYDLQTQKVHISLSKKSVDFTGSAIEPAVSLYVMDSKTGLPAALPVTAVEGTDYKVTYSNNTSPGTATVTVTGIGNNFSGTLTSSFTINKLSSLPFVDVPEGAWFYPSVEYVYYKGIMTGKTAAAFAPSETLVRAQFASILYRMSGAPDVTYKATFPDVPEGAWFAKAVIWASEQKIVSGYSNRNFGPNDLITREQMALMMYRYAQNKGLSTNVSADLDSFPDANRVSSYAADAMKWAVGKGIISGKNGKLEPGSPANRAECATIIRKFCEAYGL